MVKSPCFYGLRWHIPRKESIASGIIIDDVSIGGIEHVTATELKTWVLARDWPPLTVFEVTRRDSQASAVRCHLGHIRDWRVSQRKLPLGSSLDLPASRRSELQIFGAMIDAAFEYAKKRSLLEAVIAEDIQAALLQLVMKKAAEISGNPG